MMGGIRNPAPGPPGEEGLGALSCWARQGWPEQLHTTVGPTVILLTACLKTAHLTLTNLLMSGTPLCLLESNIQPPGPRVAER